MKAKIGATLTVGRRPRDFTAAAKATGTNRVRRYAAFPGSDRGGALPDDATVM
jgi:hypothetical protein